MRSSWLAIGCLGLLGCEVPACGGATRPNGSTVVSAPSSTASSPPSATAKTPDAPACKPIPNVANLADSWPKQAFTSWAGDKSPAVEKACKGLAAKHDLLVQTLGQTEAQTLADVSLCFPSAKGAWFIEPKEVKRLPKTEDDVEPGWEMPYTLAYLTPEGKTIRSAQVSGTFSRRNTIEVQHVSVQGLYDYDGDGISEIGLTTSHRHGDEDRTETTTLYSWKKGDAIEYSTTSGSFEAMRDVDNDGRPDLLLKGPFVAEVGCSYDGELRFAPMQIAHSLPNGEFSIHDDIAKEVVRLQCGPATTELIVTTGEGASRRVDERLTMLRVTCARMYGVSADELAKRLRQTYPFPHEADDSEPQDGPGMCMPLKNLLKLAAQSPTVVLDGHCVTK